MRSTFWIFILISFSVYGQNEPSLRARSAALGNVSLSVGDPFSTLYSYSNLKASKEQFGICLSNHFSIQELSTAALAYVLKHENSGTGLAMELRPYPGMLQTKLALAHSLTLFKNVNIGLGLSYQHFKYQDFQTRSNINAGLAASIDLSDEFQLYLQWDQIVLGPQLAVYNIGSRYTLRSNLSWYSQLQLQNDHHLDWRNGLELNWQQSKIRLGFQSQTSSISFGMAFGKKHILEFACNYHPLLGISPSISYCHAP